jgi:hypothetical protein
VETAVKALLQVSPQDSEKDLCDRSATTVNRYLAASSSATRRGWDQQDVGRRSDKRLVKFDRAIFASPSPGPAETANGSRSRIETLKNHVVLERQVADAHRANPVRAKAKPGHARSRAAQSATRT